MTIICALHEPDVGTWIASDSLITAGKDTAGHVQKWIRRGNCGIGITGTGAVLSIAQDHLEFDESTKPTELTARLNKLLDDHGFKPKTEHSCAPDYEYNLLLATPKGVIDIESDGCAVTHFADGFAAIGTGKQYAIGAAWVLSQQDVPAHEIIEKAIKAAMSYCRGCGGKIWLDCLRVA